MAQVAEAGYTGATTNGWVINAQGSHADMKLEKIKLPEPAAGQVRIKVAAACTNPVDFKRCMWPLGMVAYPAVIGVDGAGVVDAVGEGVDTHKVGDRVQFVNALSSGWGSFAEHTITAAAQAFAIPAELTFEQAAALPTAAFTAYDALFDKLRIESGKTIFITGGAGGVGQFAIQLAVNAGATVISSCSTGNVEALKALGVHRVIDYKTEQVPEVLKEFTKGAGIDYLFDCVGADSLNEAAPVVGLNGKIATIVGAVDKIDPSFFMRGISVFHVLSLICPPAKFKSYSEEVSKQVVAGTLKIDIAKTVKYEEAKASLDEQATGRVKGKIILSF